MADQTVGLGERLVVERRVEQRARKIGAERAADLDRAVLLVDGEAVAEAPGGEPLAWDTAALPPGSRSMVPASRRTSLKVPST